MTLENTIITYDSKEISLFYILIKQVMCYYTLKTCKKIEFYFQL